MIEREHYMEKIRPVINKNIIKTITGIRRCGKLSLLILIIKELEKEKINKENIILINLDSKEYINIQNTKELDKLIQKKQLIKKEDYTYFLMKYKIYLIGKD